jgi:predicted phage terminase large subunit-like protein
MSVRIYDAERAPGISLWPEERPWAWLMDKKDRMPRSMYNAQYRNNPSGLKGVRYDVNWLNFYTEMSLPPLSELDGIQAGDPATSESTSSNYFGHATVGRHRQTGIVYVLDFAFGHIPAPGHLPFLRSHYNIWKSRGLQIRKVLIETVGPQQGTTQNLIVQTRADPEGPIPLESLTPKGSKELRFDTLLPYMSSGTILFRGKQLGDGSIVMSDQTGFQEFLQEFSSFPKGGRDDVLDALWMATSELLSRIEAAGQAEGTNNPDNESYREGVERRTKEYDQRGEQGELETARDRVLSNTRNSSLGLFHRQL